MANELPPLPAGFQLDQERPPLPEGFTLDAPRGTNVEQPHNSNVSLGDRALQMAGGAAREIGRAGKNLAEGVTALPGLITDAPANIYEAATGNQAPAITKPYQSFANALESPALADQNTADRITSGVTRGLGGIVGGGAIGEMLLRQGTPFAMQLAKSLMANPAAQATAAVTGTAAGEGAREAGAGPTEQFLASMAGSLAPGATSAAAQATTRGLLRGSNPGPVADNVAAFNAAGTSPTVGQATQSRQAQAVESFLSRIPGGAGPVAKKAAQQADEIGAGIEQQASKLAPTATPQKTGLAIDKGITGDAGFIQQGKATQTKLYDKVDQFVPKDARVDVSNTRDILGKLNALIPGAENTSKAFVNPRINGIKGALDKDLMAAPLEGDFENTVLDMVRKIDPKKAESMQVGFRDGALPYEAVKKLRTLVGQEIENNSIASDVPKSKWKALYGALSSDIENNVSSNPQAKSAWDRANNYTRAFHDRLDTISSAIDKNGGPEAIYKAVLSGTKDGDTVLRATMQSLPADAQKQVAATVIRKLGEATPGQAGTFSNERLLTNWRSLSPEAKRTLFNRFDSGTRAYLDNLEKVTMNLRQGSKVFANPSGTAGAMNLKEGATGIGVAALTGHPLVAAGIAGGMGGSNMLARQMMNPSENFLNFLSARTALPNPQINNLAVQAQRR